MNQSIEDLFERVKAESRVRISVRAFLLLFGQERRGSKVVDSINATLKQRHLITQPDFQYAHIDSDVEILREEAANNLPEAGGSKNESVADSKSTEHARDSLLTVGQLLRENAACPKISRHDSVEKAVTLLLSSGVSCAVVMAGDRQVDGLITWATIGRARAASQSVKSVGNCMETHPRIVEVDYPLFDAVRDIIRHEAVVVRDTDKTIKGILTASDIAEQFVSLSEPFLYLEQIETHLRHILYRAKPTKEELHASIDPRDSERSNNAKSIDDFSFGELIRCLERSDIWARTSLGLDRSMFCKQLNEIRIIRNKVMHFHPDGISINDRATLGQIRNMLYTLVV